MGLQENFFIIHLFLDHRVTPSFLPVFRSISQTCFEKHQRGFVAEDLAEYEKSLRRKAFARFYWLAVFVHPVKKFPKGIPVGMGPPI